MKDSRFRVGGLALQKCSHMLDFYFLSFLPSSLELSDTHSLCALNTSSRPPGISRVGDGEKKEG